MAQTNSPNAKCDYLATLGEIQATHLGELNDATNTLLSAFEISPLKQNIVTPLVLLLKRRQDWANLRTVIQNIASHLEQNPHDAACRIAWISNTCGHLAQCKVEVEAALQKIKDLNIPIPNDQSISASSSQITLSPAPNGSRKRTTTSPRGSLTVDSALLRNPEPPKPNSAVSMLSVPPTIPPITLTPEPSHEKSPETSQDNVTTSQNDAVSIDSLPLLPDDALSTIDEPLPFLPDDAITQL